MFTHSQCVESEFRLYIEIEINTATASLIKVPTLKVGVYLVVEVHYTLFTDPT